MLCPATQSGIIALPYTTVHGQFGKQHHTALPEAPEIRKRRFISLSLDLPLVAMACDVPEWSDFLGGHNQRRPIRWLSRAQGRDLQSVSRHVHNDRMAQCESVQDLHFFPVSPPRFQWTHAQTPIDTTLGLVRPPLIHWHKNLEGSRGRQSRSTPALHQVAQKPGIAPRAAHSVGHAPCCPWLVLTASVGASTHRHTHTKHPTAAHSPSITHGLHHPKPGSPPGFTIVRRWSSDRDRTRMDVSLLARGWAVGVGTAAHLTSFTTSPHTLHDAAGLAAATIAG